jgi:folate-binding protein YgfZ
MPPTEQAATITPTATPLAEWIASSGGQQELASYRGVLTPPRLDAPERETEALIGAAAVHDLGWMRRVSVTGEDRFRWLSGMVTNTVNDLAPGSGAWNLVLNAQGRIQGDLWVWRDGDQLALEIAADQYDKLLEHLNRFIIMDDVELVPLENETVLGLTGPRAGEVLLQAGLPTLSEPLMQTQTQWNGAALTIRRSFGVLAPHYELCAPTSGIEAVWQALLDAGAIAAGTASLDAFRVAEGIPVYGIDIVERDLPQETSQTRALHFSKGCYLGQEIVERIRSRGNVHRHLRHLELAGPVPFAGTDLFLAVDAVQEGADRKAEGHIRSAAALRLASGTHTFALAMMRAEAEVGDHTFTYTTEEKTGTAVILSATPVLKMPPARNSDL